MQNYLDILDMKMNELYPYFFFVYLTWRQMKSISCFPDPGCYALVKQTQKTDLDFGNPELGNETK